MPLYLGTMMKPRFAAFCLALALMGLLPHSGHAAFVREAKCITTENNHSTTSAGTLEEFRRCLKGTQYEADYRDQCLAAVKDVRNFSGSAVNCEYHSTLKYFCTLTQGSVENIQACVDAQAEYGLCVYYPSPTKPMLAATDFTDFLHCVRGTPFHLRTDAECKSALADKKETSYTLCLKRNFVSAYCRLQNSDAAQLKACMLQYSAFMNVDSSNAAALAAQKDPSKRVAGMPYGDGSDYVWTKLPPRKPRVHYRPVRRPANPSGTYAYYRQKQQAYWASARLQKIDSYTKQATQSVGASDPKVQPKPKPVVRTRTGQTPLLPPR